MKQPPPAFAGAPALWAASKPPLLRFLDRCHADFSKETIGAVADYIPELGKATYRLIVANTRVVC